MTSVEWGIHNVTERKPEPGHFIVIVYLANALAFRAGSLPVFLLSAGRWNRAWVMRVNSFFSAVARTHHGVS